MSSFDIQITSDAAAAAAQLKAFPEKMVAGIVRALDYLNEITVGYIQATKLSLRGPKTLGVISNRLRDSIRRTNAILTADGIESGIGSNVAYAGIHEFGFDGDEQVKSHKRRMIAFDRYEKKGSHFEQTQWGIKGTVRAFTRHMRMPARAYIRTSLQERSAEYTAEISSAILAAWQGGAS